MLRSVQQPGGVGYQFGDSDIAARRLSTVARVFAPSSAKFLEQWAAPSGGGLAVDLGCGPGHSTRLLARMYPGCQVVGLDTSATFLAQAEGFRESSGGEGDQGTEGPGARDRVSFLQHDVTRTPFPTPGADVLYARLLLSHLTEPEKVVSRWIGELTPEGVLLVDEVDAVVPEHPLAADYQQVVEALLRNKGQRLDVGKVLSRLDDLPAVTVRGQQTAHVRPSSRDVGLMFSLNFRVWSGDPFLLDRFGAPWLGRLQAGLDAAAAGAFDFPVVWYMRQMALGR